MIEITYLDAVSKSAMTFESYQAFEQSQMLSA